MSSTTTTMSLKTSVAKRIFFSAQKVVDHNHLLGTYRSAAHSSCNLQYSIRHARVPCIFHNFRGYDASFVVQALSKSDEVKRLFLIAENSEKFKAMSINSVLVFVDSLQHLPSSLDALTQNLLHGTNGSLQLAKQRLLHLTDYCHRKGYSDEKFQLLLRKGVYPYSYMTSPEKLQEKKLPTRDQFYDVLQEQDISEADYNHAASMWRVFGIKNLKEYTAHYLALDLLLLADIMQNYRMLALKNYSLDPVHYFTSPSLTMDAALRKTRVEIELLTDIDMYHFFQKGIRGGLSYICKRSSEASEHVQLKYYDSVNLYGKSMMHYAMPIGEYEWISDWFPPPETIVGEDVVEFITALQTEEYNYIIECDAEFPEEIHDKMADFPFLPEVRKSPSALVPPQRKYAKLINHLEKRQKYVLSFEMFLLARFEGVIFTRVYRVLRYRQARWMEPYIKLNTELRTQATTAFAQDFFKLLNNSLYGKLMEDVTKRVDFELFTNRTAARYVKLNVKQPYRIKRTITYQRCLLHSQTYNHDDDDRDDNADCDINATCVIGVEKYRRRVTLDRAIQVGFKILEMAKVEMYKMYYRVLVPKFGKRMKLLAHDTDSFIIEIRTTDLNEEISSIRQHFDLSNYATDHPLYDPTNRKVPGKLKDEYPKTTIIRFIGLSSKCYAFETEDGDCVKKAKGVNKSVVRRTINFEDFERCLNENIQIHRDVTQLRSIKQTIYTVRQRKLALSNKDDKRWIQPDGINTLPWGHCNIDDEYVDD